MSDPHLLCPLYNFAKRHPTALALSLQSQQVNYGELLSRIQSIAGWIRQRTQQRNPRIGILAGRSPDAYVAILAAVWSGAAYVPINPKVPAPYREKILRAARLDALIVDKQGATLLAADQPKFLPSAVLALGSPLAATPVPFDGLEELENSPPLEVPVESDPQDAAYIMFTSGTTGTPKGIVVSQQNLLHLLDTLQRRYRISPQDRLSQFFELTFDLSVFDIFMAVRSGASLHVVPDNQLTMPANFIREHQLTVWFSVPSLIGLLAQMKLLTAGSFPSLRLSLFCGEALPAASAQVWSNAAPDSRIENLYGPTEATVACLLQDYSESDAVTPNRGIIAIGTPFTGLHAAILDEKQHFLSAGEQGELAISGPQVSAGYLNNPELTADRFPILSHPSFGTSRWYRTGDLAYRDATDRYHFLGRVDNQIKIRGNRVELDEIEFHLRAASGCDNSVALSPSQPADWNRQIYGVISGPPQDLGELRKQMHKRLPAYMVPKRILHAASLPRNSSGKIDRKALSAMILDGTLV